MDFNHNEQDQLHHENHTGDQPYGYSSVPPVKASGQGFVTGAMIFGILSIITAILMTVYLPFILGSLSILFALLSKGRDIKLQTSAKIGVICSILGFFVNLSILFTSLFYIRENPTLLLDAARAYDIAIEQRYGVSSEELLGDSVEDTVNDILNGF